jgi:hypothetical protein
MISKYYKALVVFLTGFGGFLVATNADPTFAGALPQGFAQWVTMVGVPAVLAGVAWLKRNENTVDEAEALVTRARQRVAEGKQEQ